MELPLKIALGKADALLSRLRSSDSSESAFIVCADTIALYKGVVREKPENVEQAIEFLSSYSHEDVSTVTAVVVTHYPSGCQAHGVDVATVHWGELSSATIDKVVAKGNVLNAAGGFIVEDSDLSKCVNSITGTSDSIMGLPVKLMVKLIKQVAKKCNNFNCESP